MADDRLLETSELPLERQLLLAAAEEAPPSGTRLRSLAALGLLGVATAPASAAAAPVGAGAVVGFAAWHWAFKLGIGLGIGAVLGGGLVAVQGSPRSVGPTVGSPVSVGMAQPRVPESSAEAVPSVPLEPSAGVVVASPVASSELPVASRRAVSSTPRLRGLEPARSPAPLRSSSIRDEVRLLDRARAALARGAKQEALAALAEYAARYPQGVLREEAAVVRGQTR